MEKTKSEMQDTLVQLVRATSDKRTWAESLLRIVRTAKNSRGENRNRELTRLETKIVAELAKESDEQQLQRQTLKVNHDFVTNILQFHQELTENELLLCCFFRMKLSSDTIASLKGISQASLNVARSRLKNKLGIADGQNLEEFLQQF